MEAKLRRQIALMQHESRRFRPLPATHGALLALLAALVVLPQAITARADAADNPVTNTIGRANVDGSGVNPGFISLPFGPGGITVDADHIFWANGVWANGVWAQGGYEGSVARANIDGTGVEPSFIGTGDSYTPGDLAVDADHIYWANWLTGTIGRANLDGTGADQAFITGAPTPQGVAVDGAHVYWANSGVFGTIGRADLDGTNVDEGFIDGGAGLYYLAVDANHVYWTNLGTETIGRANLDGTNPNPAFISGAKSWVGIAVDAGHVYWTVRSGAIGRANLDGSGVDTTFITGIGYPNDVAVDADHIYWTNGAPLTGSPSNPPVDTTGPKTKITKGAPNKLDKRKVKLKFKSSESTSTFECKLDKGKWKACKSPKKYRGLKKGRHKFQVRAIDAAGNVDPTPAKDKFKVVG